MLMKTPYKTAQELNLTPDQYEGLVRTVKYLRENTKLFKYEEIALRPTYRLKNFVFSMNWWNFAPTPKCGTARCIGGTAEYLMKKVLWKNQWPGGNTTLHEIFYPDNVDGAYYASPSQAADVVENYLLTGQDTWAEVIGD